MASRRRRPRTGWAEAARAMHLLGHDRPLDEAPTGGPGDEGASANLFGGIAPGRPDEQVDVLVKTRHVRLERIVSFGQATPPGQWYDQARDEWVAVLRGSAGLRFEDSPSVVVLRPGDHLVIPAHRRHRVEWTEAGQPTVWLALHY